MLVTQKRPTKGKEKYSDCMLCKEEVKEEKNIFVHITFTSVRIMCEMLHCAATEKERRHLFLSSMTEGNPNLFKNKQQFKVIYVTTKQGKYIFKTKNGR